MEKKIITASFVKRHYFFLYVLNGGKKYVFDANMNRMRRLWLRTSREEIVAAQNRLLGKFTSPERVRVKPMEMMNGINAIEVSAVRESGNNNGRDVVLAHGFGSGLAMWMSSLQHIAELDEVRRVIAFDWLGMGASERPACYDAPRVSLSPLWKGSTPDEARDFFVDSMEAWRKITVLMTWCS